MSVPVLSVVVVNTNHCDLLIQCLSALQRADLPPESEIIVVDNCSADESVETVRRDFPDVILVTQEKRRGPAANYNAGFAIAGGEFLVVLNEDAEVAPDTLRRMLDYMISHPKTAIAGPRLTYPDGRPQISCSRFPGYSSVYKRLLLQAVFNGPWVQNHYQEETDNKQFEPDWIMATSLMIRRKALDETGPYDEQFVIYYEELELCRRLRSLGWTVAWLPDAVVKHHHGVSNLKLRGDRDITFRMLLYQSRYRYFLKHHGRTYTLVLRISEAALFALFFIKTRLEATIPSHRATASVKAKLYRLLMRFAITFQGCPELPQG